MPSLLLEIGCEELPASACREAEAQLPALVEKHLGVSPSRVYVSPRRIAFVVDDLPEAAEERLVKGPPVALAEQAAEGFARKHGLTAADLEERGGQLWARVPGEALRGEVLQDRLLAVIWGFQFGKSMRWDARGWRFARPTRWLNVMLDKDALAGSGTTNGRRFMREVIPITSAQTYLETLRAAQVEPDAEERRRRIVEGLDALGEWHDPLGKLDEVVYMVEWPLVLESSFDERFLRLPERVVVTAMQSHQRYFPLGGNRFAIVASGGDPAVTVPGYTQVLNARLADAAFTFDRDAALGIEELAGRLGRITFFEGDGTLADKAERLRELVVELGGGEEALEAARLCKADQASELVREFPDLEGVIGGEYARLAGLPEGVCLAVAEHFLPDGADAPLPSTEAGRIVSAADKLDTLRLSFALGHRPSGSRDPYGLRRAAIGLCRLAVEGGVAVPHEVVPEEVRAFLAERLEGYLNLPVEYVRAARTSAATSLGGVAERARFLAALDPERLALVHEAYVRSARLAKGAPGRYVTAHFQDDAERALHDAIDSSLAQLGGDDLEVATAAAEKLAVIVDRFFEEVLVMHDDPTLRDNRLKLLGAVRDAVGALGDLSELPL